MDEAVAHGHVGQALLRPLELLEQHEVTRYHDDLSGVGAHLPRRRSVARIGCRCGPSEVSCAAPGGPSSEGVRRRVAVDGNAGTAQLRHVPLRHGQCCGAAVSPSTPHPNTCLPHAQHATLFPPLHRRLAPGHEPKRRSRGQSRQPARTPGESVQKIIYAVGDIERTR
eukprot:scaffold94452_cov75-Phaeocystis_antarctica.AAC.2